MAPDDDVPSSPTWLDLVRETTRRLEAAGVPAPGAEARWLVEEVSGLEGSELTVDGRRPATRLAHTRLERLVERRVGGEPIQYVLGRWGFRGLDLFVDPRVLIPRPETEGLVDHALAAVDRARAEPPGRTGPVRVADLGTGSGAIALALAAERSTVEVWATDASPDALAVARANLAGVGRPAQRVRLVEGSWFDALPPLLQGSLDVVVSNPPYIADDEDLPEAVSSWEPRGALRAGPHGLEAVELIVDQAPRWLTERGTLVVEIAPHQRDAVLAAAVVAGFDAAVEPDAHGRPRVLVARGG